MNKKKTGFKPALHLLSLQGEGVVTFFLFRRLRFFSAHIAEFGGGGFLILQIFCFFFNISSFFQVLPELIPFLGL